MTLQLTRLRIEQLRRFRQPFELAGLSPGLNILAGPNEAGKSTLVRAIRAAFFERHRSNAAEHLRPHGDSAAAPTIELDFLLDGQAGQLRKTFLARKRCELQWAGQRHEGAEAEDWLAQRFGFSYALKGESKPQNWGIPGLLWVEQGEGQRLDVDPARDYLHDALAGQAGQGGTAGSALAASGGDELLERLRAQRQLLLTPKGGAPTGELAQLIKQGEALAAEREALDRQIQAYRQQVDALAALRQQHAADEAARPWEALQAQLDAARARQTELQAQQAQLASDLARQTQLAQTRELLLAQLAQGTQLQAALAQRQQALDEATRQEAAAQVAARAAQAPWQAAQAASVAAREALNRARQAQQRAQLAQQRDEARAQLAQGRAALAQAQSAQAALDALRRQPAAQPFGATQLQQLRSLERAWRDAELRRQAVATRLQFTLPPGPPLALRTAAGTQPLQGQGEQLLDAPATLALPGGGELTITPGGQDLAARAAAQVEAQAALQAALRGLGLADLAEAEARALAHAEWQTRHQLAQQALAHVAPQGLEALRAVLAQAEGRAQAAEQALGRLVDVATESAEAAEPTDSPEAAEARLDAARQAEQRAQQGLAQAQAALAAAQSRLATARQEQQSARDALDNPARQTREAQAQQQLLAVQGEEAALAARIAQAQAGLAEARPDIVAQDIARLQASVGQRLAQHQQRAADLQVRAATLQQAGALGLEEQRDTLAGEQARVARRVAELQRRARALDWLCRTLDAKRQATLARLQAPLQQRLQHYLPLLLPGARVEITEALAPGQLLRPGPQGQPEAGAVDELSFGAREQLGLIARFAYADLLREAGRPTLLILDDALVHSDAGRLAQMKRVLFDAAQRHQVLLFTCHPEDWQDMGVPLRHLAP